MGFTQELIENVESYACPQNYTQTLTAHQAPHVVHVHFKC